MPIDVESNPNAIAREGVRTRCPRIGGRELKVEPNPFFEDPAFLRMWHPGRRGIVYAAGCKGTYDLARQLGMPVFKVGMTTTRLQDRLAHLGRDRYAAGRWVNGTVLIEPGHEEWMAEPIVTTLNLSRLSPVFPMNRGIGITLPASYSPRDFDRDLSAALRTAEVRTFARTDVGRAHCAAVGFPAAEAGRVTCYDFGGDVRISEAREIMIFRPRIDGNRLAAVVEALLAAHVMRQVDA